MKTISAKKLKGTDMDVAVTGCRSIRMVTDKDNMGFSVNKTSIPKGGPQHWHYHNHLEACYCVSGKGILTNLETKEIYKIEPETIYLLDNHDNHTFQALEDTVLISVFNPPLSGFEKHDKHGSYPKSNYVREKAKKIVETVNRSHSNYDACDSLISML